MNKPCYFVPILNDKNLAFSSNISLIHLCMQAICEAKGRIAWKNFSPRLLTYGKVKNNLNKKDGVCIKTRPFLIQIILLFSTRRQLGWNPSPWCGVKSQPISPQLSTCWKEEYDLNKKGSCFNTHSVFLIQIILHFSIRQQPRAENFPCNPPLSLAKGSNISM